MKNILICSDGSDYSKVACHYGVWLAKQQEVSIDVLYVTDLRQFEIPTIADIGGSLGAQPYDGMITQLQAIEEQKAKFIKEQTMNFFEAEGLKERTVFHHKTGLLVDSIAKHSENADMIILGKRGENANFAKEHLGSMLERVVRAATKPCLVTNREFKPINRVAVAYDGGQSSRKALQFVANNPFFKNLDLNVITVDEEQKEDLAHQYLEEARQVMGAAELCPTYQKLTGEVESSIVDYVKSTKVDLLIAGAYGHSRIRKLLIGSTTTELLLHCYIPVLCFR